jgi:hypothetical protein
MHPYTVKFGGGAAESVLHPAVLVAMLLAVMLFFVLPRKYVIVPFLLSIFLIPQGQQLYVGGIHLYANRLLILAAFIRAKSSQEFGRRSMYAGGWNSIDTAFVGYVVIVAAATMMQYLSIPALVNQVGYLWDFLLGYLALRGLVRDERDTVLAIKCCAVLMVIFAVCMVVEQKKMLNVFGMLGGVPSVPEVRDGKIRAQAVFQHSLTAGTFAAAAIPLFILLWKNKKAKLFSIIGVLAATVMTFATQTSTSLLTEAAGILGVFLWPLREKMKMVRTGLVSSIIALDIVMKAPVWFLIAHIDLTGSSSSYHRAELIDQFVNHFSSWWLMGTKDAAAWGWDMWDAQDMYVSVGEAGGLAALIFYILVVSRSFAKLGNARKRAGSKQQEWLLWLLGSALFANVVAFFGVNYFDQSRIAWFLLLSMICASTAPMLRRDAIGSGPKIELRMQVQEGIPLTQQMTGIVHPTSNGDSGAPYSR